MTQHIYDADAIRERRRELFGSDERAPYPVPRLVREAGAHCDICPHPPQECCIRNCRAERVAQNGEDGVTITELEE